MSVNIVCSGRVICATAVKGYTIQQKTTVIGYSSCNFMCTFVAVCEGYPGFNLPFKPKRHATKPDQKCLLLPVAYLSNIWCFFVLNIMRASFWQGLLPDTFSVSARWKQFASPLISKAPVVQAPPVCSIYSLCQPHPTRLHKYSRTSSSSPTSLLFLWSTHSPHISPASCWTAR